jgi:release factor glutamine methyltransferase
VLVPRPETELLVDWVAEIAPADGSVLDWGTGSGAIALGVADERADLVVTGVDVSDEALSIARGNDAGGLVEWLTSDAFGALAGRRFDVVVANPPYLSDAELAAAPPELGFEPPVALASGPTGFEAIERIVHDAPAHLSGGGWLLLEVGLGQAADVVSRLTTAGFVDVVTRADFAGIDRLVGGRWP